MLTEQITSRQNPLIKRAQRIRAGQEPGHIFVEGARLVEEAVESGAAVEAVIYTSEFAASPRGAALLGRSELGRCRGALVPAQLVRSVCDVESPQGVIALAAQPRFGLADLFEAPSPIVVVLDALQDPGNVGTIVRATEAAGGSGVAATPGTAEPYGPKALRASMGSAFRLPIVRRAQLDALAREARSRGMAIYATDASGETSYADVDWRRPALLVVGNEGAGLSVEARAAASHTIAIPLAPRVESLNAATAAAVILFEAARQRAAD